MHSDATGSTNVPSSAVGATMTAAILAAITATTAMGAVDTTSWATLPVPSIVRRFAPTGAGWYAALRHVCAVAASFPVGRAVYDTITMADGATT